MAKVRVRALKKGYDGQVRREPGDEFNFDVDVNGHGTWFEIVEDGPAPVREKVERAAPKKKRRSAKRDDDLLA